MTTDTFKLGYDLEILKHCACERSRTPDFLQLTTDQKKADGKGFPRPGRRKSDRKKAYREELPRPGKRNQIFFSEKQTTVAEEGKWGWERSNMPLGNWKKIFFSEEILWGRNTTARRWKRIYFG